MTKVPLEHEDAPVLKKYSIGELKQFLKPFKSYRIIPERFPVKTKLHSGWKARLFNDVFVGAFNLMPKALVRPFGWHLMAFATKINEAQPGKTGKSKFDVLVIGGGIHGAITAWDAALRGLSVALIERGILAAGRRRTASRSSTAVCGIFKMATCPESV